MDTDHREEMLKLREELLLVEEERKAGKKVYAIDELDEILNEVIDNVKQSRYIIFNNPSSSNLHQLTYQSLHH